MNLPLLYQLQHLHKEADAIGKRLKELYEAREGRKLKEEYQRLKKEYEKGEEKLKKNSYQQEVRNNEVKNLDYNKKSCEEIKFSRETDTVKKLEGIEKQLEKLDEKKQAAENDIIELINEADNISKELADTKKRMSFIKKKYMSAKEGTDKEIQELEMEKSELDTRIESLREEIDKESFEMYRKLQKTHADPVAMVESKMCSGCKMEVPAMDYQALKNGSQDIRCQSCGRLLYYNRL